MPVDAPAAEVDAGAAGAPTARRLPAISDTRFALVSGVLLFLLAAVFAFSAPIGSSADEPTHIVRAAGAVRGDLGGSMTETPSPAPGVPNSINYPVTVPESYAEVLTQPNCYAFHPDVSASCRDSLSSDMSTSSASTYVASYPPSYYLIVGLPSLVLPAAPGTYAMRLVSAAIAASLLALGLVAARRSGGPILVSCAALGITPMVIHMAASVNPSGVEMAAGFATWLTAIELLRQARRVATSSPPQDGGGLPLALPRSPLVSFTVAASVLLIVRPSGIVVMSVITASCLVMFATRRSLRFLVSQRSVQTCAAIVGACAISVIGWILYAKSTSVLMGAPLPGLTKRDIVIHTFDQQAVIAHQVTGVFGWLDAPLPDLLWKTWIAVAVVLVIAAFVVGNGRQRIGLTVTAVIAVVLPPMSQVTNAAKYGYIWSGRYQHPFTVGLLLLAGFILATQLPLRRSVALNHWAPLIGRAAISTLSAVGLTVALVVIGQRFGTGVDSSRFGYLADPEWTPPVSTRALLAAVVLLASTWGLWTGVCLPSRNARDDKPAQ